MVEHIVEIEALQVSVHSMECRILYPFVNGIAESGYTFYSVVVFSFLIVIVQTDDRGVDTEEYVGAVGGCFLVSYVESVSQKDDAVGYVGPHLYFAIGGEGDTLGILSVVILARQPVDIEQHVAVSHGLHIVRVGPYIVGVHFGEGVEESFPSAGLGGDHKGICRCLHMGRHGSQWLEGQS